MRALLPRIAMAAILGSGAACATPASDSETSDPSVDVGALGDASPDAAAMDHGAVDSVQDAAAADSTEMHDAPTPVLDAGPAQNSALYDGWLGKPVDPESLPLAAFVTVTAAYGVDSEKLHGACVAVNDVDGDGDQDVVLIEWNMKDARIHTLRLGGPEPVHVFTDVDTSVFDPRNGCVLADLTADGKPDLVVAGSAGLGMYKGGGDGSFSDVSEAWLPYIMDFNAFSVAMVDLDGDKDLDIYVGAGLWGAPCNTMTCGLKGHNIVCDSHVPPLDTPELQDRVLINGATLPMQDKTAAWKLPIGGVQTVAMPLDADGDGKMDMLVCDDFGAHYVLRNQGGSFVTHGTDVGLQPYASAMGWGVGDFDADGKPDLVLADSGTMAVYMQQAPGKGAPLSFLDKGGEMGVWWPTYGTNSWSPLVADFDHDGQDDLFVGAADTVPASVMAAMYEQCTFQMSEANPGAGSHAVDLLFLRDPKGAMVGHHLPAAPYADFTILAQQLVDLDGDGDLDVVQARPGPNFTTATVIRFLRNDLPKKGGAIRVRLTGIKGNKDAIGARITAQIDGVVRTRWLSGSGGFGGTPLRMAHFGLGQSPAATDVTVHWPDGKKTKVGVVKAGATATASWP